VDTLEFAWFYLLCVTLAKLEKICFWQLLLKNVIAIEDCNLQAIYLASGAENNAN
jgi:hypothetical protein